MIPPEGGMPVRCVVCGVEDAPDEMLYCEVCECWLCTGLCANPHVDQEAERHEDNRRLSTPN